MAEDFESMMNSQLMTLRNQMEVIRDYIDRYEERSIKLKKTITNELITALISRFENNEKMIQELNEKVESCNTRLQDNLSKSLKEMRDEISERDLDKAILRIAGEKEIKVSSKALEELKNI